MANKKTSAAPAQIREMTYSVLPDRMPRIPDDKMTSAQKKVAEELAAGPRGSVRGPFWPLMRSPEFTRRVQKVGEYIRFQGDLELRINELAALLGARSWTQQYEWNAHVPHALKAGVKPATIQAIEEGRRPTSMPEDEEIVYEFVTELLATKGVSDPTYARTVKKFGEKGVIDILGIVGYYTMLAMVMNVARTAIPDGKPLPLAPLPHQIQPNALS